MPEASSEPHPRVTILTSVHPWNDPRIFLKEATSLATAGMDVTLVAECETDNVMDGIKLLAIPPARNRWERMILSPLRILMRAKDAQIVHFHDPELIPAGLLLKLLGKRVVYDVHEDLPRTVEYKYWIPAPLRRIVAHIAELVETVSAHFFDLIVAATPTIGERFPAQKTVVVQNFPILSELTVADPAPYTTRRPQFIYVGSVSSDRGAIQMLDAITLISNPDAKLLIVGNCSPVQLMDEMKDRDRRDHMRYLGYKGRKEIGELLTSTRAGIVALQPKQNYLYSFPTKLFEYMSAGLPVIASDFPIVREIVDADELGLLVDPTDPVAIAGAMDWILDHPQEAEAMGERGRKAVLSRYNWEIEARKLVTAYARLS
jgi:glycosyltransferase involved in cell wall biosynthesis